MAIFEEALEPVLKEEGGEFTDDPVDHGGATRWGLTIPDLQAFGWAGTPDEIRALTRDQAAAIYHKLYWEKIQGDSIRSQKVADLIFDQSVLTGIGSCVRVVQELIGVAVDGVLGPQTLFTLNQTSDTKLESLFIANRLRHYTGICAHDPSQMKFLRGWVNRSAELLERMFG